MTSLKVRLVFIRVEVYGIENLEIKYSRTKNRTFTYWIWNARTSHIGSF
jgi:hypothetical protein